MRTLDFDRAQEWARSVGRSIHADDATEVLGVNFELNEGERAQIEALLADLRQQVGEASASG